MISMKLLPEKSASTMCPHTIRVNTMHYADSMQCIFRMSPLWRDCCTVPEHVITDDIPTKWFTIGTLVRTKVYIWELNLNLMTKIKTRGILHIERRRVPYKDSSKKSVSHWSIGS